jgi:hypothetical protein
MPIRTAAVVLAAASAVAQAGLVIDQVGATFVNGGYSTYAAQSFTPAADTLAAIEVFVGGTAAFTADVTVSVYSGWSGGSTPDSLSGLLGSATIIDVPRGTEQLFTFDQVISTTPETTYYFLVETGMLTTGSNRQNQYDRGQVIFGGGNISNADLFFTTYAVPAPSGAAVLAVATLAALRRRR